MSTDTIEKTIVLETTLAAAWRAISDPLRFGAWFGAEIEGPFVAGRETVGRIAPTKVDPEVARLQEPHRGKPWRIVVDRIEPPHLFAFRWHPFAVDHARDYSAEPMTLVTFTLAEVVGGVRLTITETGFAQLPADRRAAAFAANDGGWAHQARLVQKYLARERTR